jgi:hypothetical protein
MLRFRTPELFLGAFLTIAVFAMGMLFEASNNPYPPTSAVSNKTTEQKPTDTKEQEGLWDWLTHDAAGFFTLFLFLAAGGQIYLFFVQLNLIRDSLTPAKDAAKAADLNARAVIALQLPLIQIQPSSLGYGSHSDGQGQTENCSVHFIEIVNQGSSRAFPKEVLYGWTVGNTLPAEPAYQFIDKFPLGSRIEPNIASPVRKFLTFNCPLKAGQRAEICRGNYLWFYVDLIYDDFMGDSRHQSSCWRWAYIGHGVDWRPDETPTYNRKT